ncbi:hypothetical protein TNCV_166331 [Trichonephila clavipes]|nr:hypothetical protein TNCV_166331 [Trichonephila clavipes]
MMVTLGEEALMLVVEPIFNTNLDIITRKSPSQFRSFWNRQKMWHSNGEKSRLSFANPTPLAHADTSRDVLPRGGTSQHVLDDRQDIVGCGIRR